MIQIPNEIKQLLKQGSVPKNFRVHFPNGEHEDLTNADIVEESVTLTESICSASQLKIGMCETPSIEFETIGVDYIKGAEMECSLEVECQKQDSIYHFIKPYVSGNTTINGLTFESAEEEDWDILKISGSMTEPQSVTYIISNSTQLSPLIKGASHYIKVSGLPLPLVLQVKCPKYGGGSYDTYDIQQDLATGRIESVIGWTALTNENPTVQLIIPSNLYGQTLNFEVKIQIKIITTSPLDNNLLQTPFVDGDEGELITKGGYRYNITSDGASFNKIGGSDSTFRVKRSFDVDRGVYWIRSFENAPKAVINKNYDEYLQISTTQGTFRSSAQSYVFLPGGNIDIEHYFGSGYNVQSGSVVFTLQKVTNLQFTRSYPSWAVYKSDIGKYVYPIPYGTYIVDSCKKQADMSHRQIIGYNKFAYNSWQFNRVTRELFNAGFYWASRDYTGVSVESLIRLVLPDRGTFEELEFETSVPIRLGSLYDDDGYEYVISGEYTGLSANHDTNISNYKVVYSPTFLSKFDEMDTLVQTLGLHSNPLDPRSAWPPFVDPLYPLNTTYFETPNYYYYMPNSIANSVAVDNGSFRNQISSRQITTLNIWADKNESSNTWHIQYPILHLNYTFYTRLKLIKKIDNDNQEILFDTGEFMPTVYQDTTAPDLFVSPSNLYIPITNKKQKINMVRSSGSSTVQKTLYKYDLSVLNSINLKDLLQSYLELQGKFGLITRDGNISFVSVNEAFNTPDDTIPKSDYYTLWYDDFPSKPYGRITASYKDSNGDDMFAYYDLVENFSEAEYKTYDISNNYFIKNYNYTEQQIQTILQTMGQNMTNISYMPMNLSMKGRPDLEAGDVVIVNSTEQSITGFIMQRTLTGIQGLVDDISSQDDTDQSLLASLGTVYDEETGTLSLYLSETRR